MIRKRPTELVLLLFLNCPQTTHLLEKQLRKESYLPGWPALVQPTLVSRAFVFHDKPWESRRGRVMVDLPSARPGQSNSDFIMAPLASGSGNGIRDNQEVQQFSGHLQRGRWWAQDPAFDGLLVFQHFQSSVVPHQLPTRSLCSFLLSAPPCLATPLLLTQLPEHTTPVRFSPAGLPPQVLALRSSSRPRLFFGGLTWPPDHRAVCLPSCTCAV